MYHVIDRLHTLYERLQDEQSKDIFKGKLAFDMDRSLPNAIRFSPEWMGSELPFLGWPQPGKDVLKRLNQDNKKIILYGIGNTGRYFARLLQWEGIGFYGFCGQQAAMFPYGLMRKPVLSPDELVAHGDEYYVVLCFGTKVSYLEVSKFLQEHNYPQEHIIDWIDQASLVGEPYFEFPELYRPNTAFIDGGSFDCANSYRFVEWCGGAYSSIFAFEPDPVNYANCCEKVKDAPLPNFQLVNAGLSNQAGTTKFYVNKRHSHIKSTVSLSSTFYVPRTGNALSEVSIRTVAIDDIICDCIVGFIKLCTVGVELDVLQGAKNTILRDKPLLAIYVPSVQGNLFAIMDYLHQLIPEYRFLLRNEGGDSVAYPSLLYASVDL